jgi:ubiquinone/menaquinone biosynthesis C-methylase UbiE
VLAPPPREAERTELMDRLDATPAELTQGLIDITRLNRIGATRTIVRQVAPFLARLGAGRTLRVLDVGTGAADIPLAIARWARQHGHRLRIVALDVHPTILAYAARATRDAPEVQIIGGDALEAPIRPGSVDLALCSLVLHHLPEDAVVRLLRRLASLARVGFIVNDFRRGRLAWAAVWLATHVTGCGSMARHDGPLSVRRAYTPAELSQLSTRAGLPDIRWHRAPMFRQIGVWVRPAAVSAHAG